MSSPSCSDATRSQICAALQRFDELVLGGVGLGVEQVGPDRVVEHVASWVTTPTVSRSDDWVTSRTSSAADQHRSPGDVVEARDQADDRRLARAGRTDQRDELAGVGLERDVVQHLRIGRRVEHGHRFERGQRHLVGRRVAEVDVVELDRCWHRPAASTASGVVGDHRRQVEHLEHPLERDERGHDVDLHVRQRRERAVQPGQVGGERDDGADVECRRSRRATPPQP